MVFKLENQEPQTFYTSKPTLPLIDVSLSPEDYEQQLKAHTFELLVRPLYTPVDKAINVNIKEVESNNTIEPIQFTEALLHYLESDVIEQELTDELNELYNQGSKHSLESKLSFDQFMALEAMASVGLPYPEPGRVIYTPGELKDAARAFHEELDTVNQSNIDKLHDQWFAKLSGYVSSFNLSNFRLITVKDHHTFNDLVNRMKQYLKQNIQLPQDTTRHISQLGSLSIEDELSIGLFLPHELENESNGFNRLLENELAKMEREKRPRVFNESYSLKGMLKPTKLVILNLEEYTHGHNLQREWKSIVQAFNNTHSIRHVKNKKLQTVQSVNREITVPTDYDGGDTMDGEGAIRSNRVSFLSKKQMSTRELTKRVSNIAKKQTVNQPTSNFKKQQKNTFMRANRRNPDDINAQGKISSTVYSPDLHIWLDTSGSISKEDYENELHVMIAIAKHLDVDIYFNSFSHVISETTKIPTKHRQPRQIFNMIESVDKVQGGTQFINVWKGIDKTEAVNMKTGQARRLHLILSDMDYSIPSTYTLQPTHPSVKNTYYIPIRIQRSMDRRHVQRFAKSLEQRGGKGMASGHILF